MIEDREDWISKKTHTLLGQESLIDKNAQLMESIFT